MLYESGPLVTCTDCVGAGDGLGDGSMLQTNSLNMNSLGFNHNNTSWRLADRFTVPEDGWFIGQVETFAYQTDSELSSTMTEVYIRIWDGHPADGGQVVFGDLETNRMVSTEWTGIYRVSETNPALTNRPIMVQTSSINHFLEEGEYYMEWATRAGDATAWAPPITIIGECVTGEALVYEVATQTWSPRIDSGSSECQQGLPFRLFGAGSDPVAHVDPDELSFSLPPDATDSATLTLSNNAPSGSDDLVYSVAVTQAKSMAGRAVYGVLEAARANVASDLLSASGYAAVPGLPEVGYALGGGIDCDLEPGMLINDDGTAENGYSANPASIGVVTLVDRFTPASYPATFTDICVAFITQSGGPSSMDFTVVAFAANGPGGAPGTLLGSVQTEATNIPAIAAGQPIPVTWQTVDISAMDLLVTEGDIYIGVRFIPQTPTNVFVAGDESSDRPPAYAGGHFGTQTAPGAEISWQAMGSAVFPNYRAMFIRAVGAEAAGGPVVSVDPTSGEIEAGSSQELTVTVNTAGLAAGTYEYQIVISTNDPANEELIVPVTIEVTTTSGEPGATPVAFALEQNYPNPFAATTTIEFALPEASPVTIEVFDLTGRRVATLVDNEMEAGYHRTTWNANGVASGVYLYRIQAGTYSQTLRALVVR